MGMESNKILRFSKISAVNLLVFLIILICLETLSAFMRFALNKPFVGYLVRFNLLNAYKTLNDPCQRMVTHPILDHIHSSEGCEIENG